jgi:peptidoglycan-associated lipoprotein
MNRYIHIFIIAIISFSCSKSNQTWEDVKTAGRHMQRGVDTALGKGYESKMLASEDEFYGPNDEDFIPLKDADLKSGFSFSDNNVPQPKGNPGSYGIPSLDTFYLPPNHLASLFQTVHFETDEHVLKDKNELANLIKLADFIKKNNSVYVVIEGHCDERASASYNMALGMRRANYVRSFLVKNGADLNRIYTVSKGKEQPVSIGHRPEDWKMNRRSEFKIYQR